MLHYPGESDTIAAIATASGRSGIAVVKISGPQSIALMRSIFRSCKDPDNHVRSMVYGHIIDGEEIIDDVLVCVMKAPKSYTGEDVVEIQTHGGSASAGATLKLLVEAGARIAGPGEFTKRAFLNGKIDLVQAEAVMEIVAAEGREYLRQAEHLMYGTFSRRMYDLLGDLRESASLVELNIDFLHQGLEAIREKDLILSIEKTIGTLDTLISSYGTARRIKDGIRVVIAGKTNSGKSSLFNTLLGKRRTIVNPAPGTTRDWVEEKIELDSVPVNLIDTAGIRETPDTIEQEGVAVTERLIRNADIILYLLEAPEYARTHTFSGHDDDRYINIISKADLLESNAGNTEYLSVSSFSGVGIKELTSAIIEKAHGCIRYGNTDTLVLVERHHSELTKARNALVSARAGIGTWSEEIISLELREAQKHIESILGRNIDIDVLDKIFASFCIGK